MKLVVTDIQNQVIDGYFSNVLKPIFKKVSDEIFKDKIENNIRITESDFECMKDKLEGYNIIVTFHAIEKFYGIDW